MLEVPRADLPRVHLPAVSRVSAQLVTDGPGLLRAAGQVLVLERLLDRRPAGPDADQRLPDGYDGVLAGAPAISWDPPHADVSPPDAPKELARSD